MARYADRGDVLKYCCMVCHSASLGSAIAVDRRAQEPNNNMGPSGVPVADLQLPGEPEGGGAIGGGAADPRGHPPLQRRRRAAVGRFHVYTGALLQVAQLASTHVQAHNLSSRVHNRT